MATPPWVSKELFENALREHFSNKNIKILGYTSSAAVPQGDNYTSDLFRTSITYETGQNGFRGTIFAGPIGAVENWRHYSLVPWDLMAVNVFASCKTSHKLHPVLAKNYSTYFGNRSVISLIVKCSPEDREHMQQLLAEIRFFEKEAEMFQTTLPAIYDLLGDYWTLSAKCIYFTSTPHTVIIFEDLLPLGFKMHERQQGFDLDHCLLTVEKLAQLHAASVVLHEKNPTLINNYSKGLFSGNATIADWISKGVDSVIKVCAMWPGYEKYSNKLAAIRDKAVARGVTASKRKLGGFNVLNHGDAWVNNFMYSYTDDGKLKDCRFVDYQLVVFTSPAIDLHYFWATSPKIEVRRQHLDTVLDRYYAQLLATLTKLGYSLELVPTRKQFREDWNSRAFYGVIAAVTVLPLVKASTRTDASFEELMGGEGEESFRYHVYNNERYRKHMEYLLPFFDSLGALDYY